MTWPQARRSFSTARSNNNIAEAMDVPPGFPAFERFAPILYRCHPLPLERIGMCSLLASLLVITTSKQSRRCLTFIQAGGVHSTEVGLCIAASALATCTYLHHTAFEGWRRRPSLQDCRSGQSSRRYGVGVPGGTAVAA